MPKLPTTLGGRATPTPQRRILRADTSALDRAYDRNARALSSVGGDLMAVAKERDKQQEKDAMLDAVKRDNDAQQQVNSLLYGDGETEGLYATRGANALDVSQKFNDRFSQIKENAMNGISNPVARAALEKNLMNIETGTLGSLQRFSQKERMGYTSDLLDARSDIAMQRVGLEWNNKDTLDASLKMARESATALAKMNGYAEGDEAWTGLVRERESQVYSTQLLAMFNSDDPRVQAQALNQYEDHQTKGRLNLESVNTLDKIAGTVRPRVEAFQAYDQVSKGDTPDDQIFTAMLHAESNNRHYRKDGSIVTSPVGAKGKAQLMEATAKEMARELGVAESAWLDPQVNEYLGQKYFEKMKGKFGDSTLAVMAYNAGPGAVSDFMNGTNKSKKNPNGKKIGDPTKGEVSMDYFIAQFPFKETRNYVNKVMTNAGGGTGMIDENRAKAVAGTLSPDASGEFMDMVERNNKAINATKVQERNQVVDEIMGMAQQGMTLSQVPPETMVRAQETGVMPQLMEYTGQTDEDMANYLYSLDPKTLLSTDLSDPSVRLKLSPEDYQRWVQKKEALGTSGNLVTAERRKKMVGEAFLKLDISTQTKNGKARALRANSLIDLEVDSFTAQNDGRYPNEAELTKIIDNVFLKGEYDVTPGWWRVGGVNQYKFDIDIDAIPKKDRESVRMSLERRGVAATEAEIIREYMNGLE